jgi:hypothetical protein
MLKRALIIIGAISLAPAIAGGVLKAIYPSRGSADRDGFRIKAIMDGVEQSVAIDSFTSGHIFGMMAGVELDMREVKVAPEGAHLRVKAIMAGVELVLPAGCRIELNDRAIFGNVQLLRNDDPPGDDAPVLRIDVTSLMAGVEIIQEPAWISTPATDAWPLSPESEPA